MKRLTCVVAVTVGIALGLSTSAQAAPIPKKYRKTVQKGLEWLAKTQHKDGHWSANGDQYPVAMTGLAGVAMLMEGSTIRSGKYADNIRRATDWLIARSNNTPNKKGLIGDTNNPSEQHRYMYGHGFALLFLASVYGDEEDADRRAKLKKVLENAVIYCANAQSTQGGWYYTSKMEGGDNDEGSVTITQVQPLRACRNAGIAVPKDVIKKAQDYLKKSTTQRGGVVYSLGRGGVGAPVGGERPALTAAAISCGFGSGDYKSELVKKWFKYCQTAIPVGGGNRMGHDEYTHFYYAQAVYVLGDDGWEKLFGATPKEQRVTWSKYREAMFDQLMQSQNADGSWSQGGGWSVGPVYSTAVYVTIMQLDKGVLPIYQR